MGFFKNLLKPGSATESNISRALRTVVVSDTPAARNDLHNALKRQRVVLPVPRPLDNLQRDASGRLQQNTRLEFLSFQDSSGRKFIAVFTNPEALKKWKSDAPSWVAIDAQSVSGGPRFRPVRAANQSRRSDVCGTQPRRDETARRSRSKGITVVNRDITPIKLRRDLPYHTAAVGRAAL